MLDEDIPCPAEIINKYGDHATCCTKQGDLIVRHNSLGNLVEDFASDGMLSPVLEKEGILGNTTGRRPGMSRSSDGPKAKVSQSMSQSLHLLQLI